MTSFPKRTGTRRVSAAGGCAPQWRSDGKELFYLGPHGSVMSVDIRAGSDLEFGTPRQLFQPAMADPGFCLARYAVTGNGQKFLVLEPVAGGPTNKHTS